MLVELYMLETYFEEPIALMLEDDLVQHYGQAAVRDALAEGLLERRRIPCGLEASASPVRHVCRLSQTGFARAGAALGLP
jgi:hypothetical protein